SLSLHLSGAGAFPGATRARVLWTGIQGDRHGLGLLAASAGAGARRAGAPPAAGGGGDPPPPTPARRPAPGDVHSLVGTLGSFAGTPWVATDIHLIHSRLGAHPRYEVIGTWPLRASPSPGPASGPSATGTGNSSGAEAVGGVRAIGSGASPGGAVLPGPR